MKKSAQRIYKVQSTEKTTGIAAEQETRALLYLLNDRKDSNQMHWFVIDFFNDVTGVNNTCSYSVDVQAKSSKSISAKKLGEFSVTLFKNYCSCLEFSAYILFVGGVGERVRRNENRSKDTFGYADMQEKSQQAFLQGLKETAETTSYIDSDWITDENISDFTKLITIVINNEPKHEIIKRIAKLNDAKVNDDKLTSIFNEIRDKQSVLKNNTVEGIELSNMSDFLPHKKYLMAEDINNLILHRLINYDLNRPIPSEFNEIVNRFEYDLRADIIKQCRNAIMRILFDKNNAKNFWALFANIRKMIEEDPTRTLDEIYASIDINLIEQVPALDILSTKFFIALIKGSFDDVN